MTRRISGMTKDNDRFLLRRNDKKDKWNDKWGIIGMTNSNEKLLVIITKPH